ncbi:thioredoxin domain-containing protein 2-like isoform X2 [Bolinopsis microptera]|uniref:thioredoxin domain-containing protein 2-like isoform X2 n=1 Tax=Bolinopsis microptera TaxID=2820187 RepID=UPI00307AA339
MLSEFAILEEVEEGLETAVKTPSNSDHGPISGLLKRKSDTGSVGNTSGRKLSSESNNSLSRNKPTSQSQPPRRRQSVAARVGSAIVRGMTSTPLPKIGISPAKERQIAAEWEQFEKDKRIQSEKSQKKSQPRPPSFNNSIRNKSDNRQEMELDTLGPLPGHRPARVPNIPVRVPGTPMKTPQQINKKNSSKDLWNKAGRGVGAPTADATDLNIMWRVQARKANGKNTTPEQMAKLRLMLKNENTGSRRSRNSVYSIDPSLLERPGRIREINSMEEFKERLDQAKEALVCVTFSAKWCGPWRMIKPDVHRLSHIHGDVEFYEIDVDDNEEIAEARRVACMPTFQFFKRGIMLDKFAEPNRIKLDETIRKLRKMEIRPEE